MVEGLDPDEMQDYIDNVKEKFQQEEQQVKQDQQEAENLEEDAKQHEDKAGQETKEAAAETEDAEDKGNAEELEDAEKEEKDAEDEAGKAEEELDAAEKDIEDEIKIEERQEDLVEDAEQKAEKILAQVRKELMGEEGEFQRLEKIQETDNGQITQEDYDKIEEILAKYKEGIQVINTTTGMIGQLESELLETEKEEIQVEQLTNQLKNEFGLMEKVVTELEQDYAKLNDKKHEQMAQKEEEELREEEKHEQQEENEEIQIDKHLANDTRELEQIVKENERLLKLVDQGINDLRQLRQLLESETQKNQWSFFASGPPLDDVKQTINVLQSGLGSDEDATQDEESRLQKIKASMTSGPGTASGARGARAMITPLKIMAVSIVLIVGVLLLYANFE